VVTVFTRLPNDKIQAMLADPNPKRDQQPLELAIWQLAAEVRSLGMGFDFVSEEVTDQQDRDLIRISMEPTGSVELLVSRCQRLQAAAIRLLQTSKGAALAPEALGDLLDAVSQIQIEPIEGGTGSRVIVTARLPLIKFLVAQ